MYYWRSLKKDKDILGEFIAFMHLLKTPNHSVKTIRIHASVNIEYSLLTPLINNQTNIEYIVNRCLKHPLPMIDPAHSEAVFNLYYHILDLSLSLNKILDDLWHNHNDKLYRKAIWGIQKQNFMLRVPKHTLITQTKYKHLSEPIAKWLCTPPTLQSSCFINILPGDQYRVNHIQPLED